MLLYEKSGAIIMLKMMEWITKQSHVTTIKGNLILQMFSMV